MTMPGFSDRELGVIRKRDALTGIRGWYPDSRNGGLKGVYGKTWKPGPHRAECEVLRHQHPLYEIPSRECWCGFWAGYSTEIMDGFHLGEKPVVGVVKGWGRIVSGERGFRAERAEITGLHLAYEYVRLKAFEEPVNSNWGNLNFSSDYEVAGAEGAAKLAEDEARLSEHFPDVPFYPSIPEMLKAHPIKRKK